MSSYEFTFGTMTKDGRLFGVLSEPELHIWPGEHMKCKAPRASLDPRLIRRDLFDAIEFEAMLYGFHDGKQVTAHLLKCYWPGLSRREVDRGVVDDIMFWVHPNASDAIVKIYQLETGKESEVRTMMAGFAPRTVIKLKTGAESLVELLKPGDEIVDYMPREVKGEQREGGIFYPETVWVELEGAIVKFVHTNDPLAVQALLGEIAKLEAKEAELQPRYEEHNSQLVSLAGELRRLGSSLEQLRQALYVMAPEKHPIKRAPVPSGH